ncbi:efflux RND transporter periplasmic adaptor subunit [Sinisalibacter lacisalsi]|uniref:Secretion protein HlyD n=1 Tax=Sinisalibacter lacisalsi TaxID=1526570 RepID=A0ABQ1QS81_9RHOB|nr:efflux RND transporter periplasmic adaptor subunit [Sinisalibacter lacisalsi]GGD43539.1 secretion protein HlyD [Sinisalibacter lacisalsi]
MNRALRIAATTAFCVLCAPGLQAQSTAPASTYGQFLTAPVVSTQIGGSATVGGTVIPFKQVTLSAQVPGQVIFIAGAEGYQAAEGEVLVRIGDENLAAQRRAAESQVLQAEAAVRNSYMQYSRELYSPRVNSITGMPGMGAPAMFDQFFTRGFASAAGQTNPGLERQADLYGAGVGVDQAQSALAAAQANLEALDASLKDFQSVAGFDGIVMAKHVEVGDTVQPGMPLITYAYVEYLRIEADVPVRLAAGLSEGMLVPARLDAGAQVEARVAQIFPVADPGRHTVTVKFDLPLGTPGGPGMYAEVTVPDASVPTQAQTAVPQEALVWRGSLPSVFVLDAGRPSLRIVRVGYPLPDGRISVVSGLSGGEVVILNPPASLVSGQ